MAKKPVISLAHQLEWKSKRKFEEAIQPWNMPFEWSIRDYGIDGLVAITKPITDSLDVEPEGMNFLVQLKCIQDSGKKTGRLSYQVPVKKILQWHEQNLPVLFALYDLKQDHFHSCWIDDELLNQLEKKNPKWLTRDSITIYMTPGQEIHPGNLSIISNYVSGWKKTSRKILKPGLYFDFKKECEELQSAFQQIAFPFQFNSIDEQIKKLELQINEAIYRVAVAGPSRTGKSSLINAMLGRKELSPTGEFQTTGVPIQILPGEKDEVKVYFQDGKSETLKFSTKTIRQFVDQNQNNDNKRKAALVTIHTPNPQLEKGISLFDIPGLDDPVESIYEHAKLILQKSNAIFYLIDASSANTGGFIFSSTYKKEILELSQKLDKIFLVFNKINSLSAPKLAALKKRVEADLKRLDLFDKVAEKIYYVSAEESLAIRLKKSTKKDQLTQLENDLWEYLLQENKIGLRRLSAALEVQVQTIRDFSSLLDTRLLDLSRKRQLIIALNQVNRKAPELGRIFTQGKDKGNELIRKHLENQKNRTLATLGQQLSRIPKQEDLPGKPAIKSFLNTEINSVIHQTNDLYAKNVMDLNATVKMWIEASFRQIWQIVSRGQQQRQLDISDFETIQIPDIDISNSLGAGALTYLVSAIIVPPYALGVALVSFFTNLLVTAEDRRARRIEKLLTQIQKKLDHAYRQMEQGYIDAFEEWTKQTRKQVQNSIQLYLNDLQQQANKIDIPPTAKEDDQYVNALTEADALKEKVISLNNKLASWYSSF